MAAISLKTTLYSNSAIITNMIYMCFVIGFICSFLFILYCFNYTCNIFREIPNRETFKLLRLKRNISYKETVHEICVYITRVQK